MSTFEPLPPEITCELLEGRGVQYCLPRRTDRSVRKAGIGMIVFGLAMLAFMAFWTWGFAGGIVEMFGPIGALAGLLALPGFVAAGGLLLVGRQLLFGATEIRLRDDQLESIERAGPFWWTRRVSVDQVRRLLVADADVTNESHRVKHPPSLVSNLAALKAELATGKKFWVTLGYPREWLLALARDLSQRMHSEIGVATEDATAVPVVDVLSVPAGEVERLEQPVDSKIEYQPVGNGFTVTSPPRGLWRGSHGLFLFALIWCTFTTVMASFMIPAVLWGEVQPDNGPKWLVVPFFGLFFAVGIGILLAAINMGRRSSALAVSGNLLMAIQIGIFGTKQQEWKLKELATARVGPSGMEVNNRPVMQLQIVPVEGKPFGMMTGHDTAELEWLATLVRRAIQAQAGGDADV